MFTGVDDAAGHDAIFNDFAFMVDVFEKEVQRCDPLGQSALDFFPFRRRDDSGQQIVRKYALCAFIIPIYRESDSLVEEGLVCLILAAP